MHAIFASCRSSMLTVSIAASQNHILGCLFTTVSKVIFGHCRCAQQRKQDSAGLCRQFFYGDHRRFKTHSVRHDTCGFRRTSPTQPHLLRCGFTGCPCRFVVTKWDRGGRPITEQCGVLTHYTLPLICRACLPRAVPNPKGVFGSRLTICSADNSSECFQGLL